MCNINQKKCEQPEMEQGTWKNKKFLVKILFLELSDLNDIFPAILVILDIVDVRFPL